MKQTATKVCAVSIIQTRISYLREYFHDITHFLQIPIFLSQEKIRRREHIPLSVPLDVLLDANAFGVDRNYISTPVSLKTRFSIIRYQ